MSRFRSIVFLVVTWLTLAGASVARSAERTLRSGSAVVAIDPQTLQADWITSDNQRLSISAPRPAAAARVEGLVEGENELRWRLPDEHISIHARLDQTTLAVDFSADASGSFDWPIVTPKAPAGFVLPMFEGVYVPVDDAPWAEFLAGCGPLDTLADLSMPFWGVRTAGHTLSYLLDNPCNNALRFTPQDGGLSARFTHTFPARRAEKTYGVRIVLAGDSPIEPARQYRAQLIRSGQFVSLQSKIKNRPDVAKLLGAAHIYLWGDDAISRHDISDFKALARRLVAEHEQANTMAARLWEGFDDDTRKLIARLPQQQWVDEYSRRLVAAAISRFIEDAASAGDDPRTALHDALGDLLAPVERWGDGVSPKMVQALSDAGLDRLWLGTASFRGLQLHPQTSVKAISLGYLIGPYDSYHSIHAPGAADTWETAQFDQHLYDTGAIVGEDGTPRRGFKQKGYLLSPIAARPYVEQRVNRLMGQFQANSWFIDCDAFGQVFDDYSPLHPATQSDDIAARLSRMKWIGDRVGAVIGSEGGSAYAAATIHFAHGVMTPVIGWGDPDLHDKARNSRYFIGGYYPPDAPAVFFKQVPMKERDRRVYADPRFRLPLYEVVFHDSLVATHHWSGGSLKFEDPDGDRELLELLYNVPPLYHLNVSEWEKRKAQILRHYGFFSPLHRRGGLLPMSDFQWLSPDRLVQRTVFGAELELVANFSDRPVEQAGVAVPAHAIVARWLSDGAATTYPAKPAH